MEKVNKSFYERAIELANNCKRVKNNKVYETLAEEFNIGLRKSSDRFKSLIGMTVGEYIANINTPTKEELRDAVIRNNTQEELLQDLNIHYDWIKGLYDKYFKVSTFRSVKLKLYNEFDIISYNPTIEDNLSILISQRLGDGSFEFNDNRSSLKLEHGYKQFEYLKFKINLLKKAFPEISGLENIKKRVYKDYISYTWRSNNFRNRYMNIIKMSDKSNLINDLTPFGWMLWYLDDGYLAISQNSNRLGLSVTDELVKNNAIKELRTYGFEFANYSNSIVISDKLEIIKFLNCFIKPFIHLIPQCMMYKCIVKI